MAKRKAVTASDEAIAELRRYGMRYPGVQIKSPWPGHEDLAVNDKTFAYLPPVGQPFSIGCKLPHSSAIALMLPYVKPTPYGLGKSGWVTADPTEDQIDLDMFKQWIDESYRAQAPKKWLAQIGEMGPFGDDPFADDPLRDSTKTAPKKAAKSKAAKPKAKKTAKAKPKAKAKAKPKAQAKKAAKKSRA